jgi:hypothetical protein
MLAEKKKHSAFLVNHLYDPSLTFHAGYSAPHHYSYPKHKHIMASKATYIYKKCMNPYANGTQFGRDLSTSMKPNLASPAKSWL